MMDSSPGYTDSPQSEHDRNPSPPPELSDHPELLLAECVGNTAFSKHWLFTTLIKLIEEVDRENEEDSNLAVDVDEELQNELCKLWDMSMNSDVAKFLHEFKAVDILSGIIKKLKAPRVIEISVGILGNMACEQFICKEMAESQEFMQLILLLMETRDVPTLVETTRLIYTSLCDPDSRNAWIKAIQRSEEFLDHLKFIFSSSTNCDLLKNSAGLVDTLLDKEPDLCISWATIDFIHSLLEATDQIGSGHTDALEVYLHIFQSFSTTESGVEALVSHIDRLEKKIIKYLNIVCEYEIVALDGKEDPLASAISVLHISMTARPKDKLKHLCKDETIIRILLKILEPLYPMLKKYQESAAKNHIKNNEDNSACDDNNTGDSKTDNGVEPSNENTESDKDVADGDSTELLQLEVLYDTLSAFLVEYCNVAFVVPYEDNKKQEISDAESDTTQTHQAPHDRGDNLEKKIDNNLSEKKDDSEKAEEKGDEDGTRILTYLDEACSRWRINNLGLVLKESEMGQAIYRQLQILARKYNKERLIRILNDIAAGKILNRAESAYADVDSGNA